MNWNFHTFKRRIMQVIAERPIPNILINQVEVVFSTRISQQLHLKSKTPYGHSPDGFVYTLGVGLKLQTFLALTTLMWWILHKTLSSAKNSLDLLDLIFFMATSWIIAKPKHSWKLFEKKNLLNGAIRGERGEIDCVPVHLILQSTRSRIHPLRSSSSHQSY